LEYTLHTCLQLLLTIGAFAYHLMELLGMGLS
jgi:hypothetical protein